MRELRIFFGGSFDPVHIAHERVAMQVSLLLNQPVYFLPTSQSPFKEACGVSDEHRLNMLRLVADASGIAIETYELQQTGVHYTADTIRHFMAKGLLPVFIVGWDAFASLWRWRESEFIRAQAAWIVVQRPSAEPVLDEALRTWWQSRQRLSRASFAHVNAGDVFECETPLHDISSTRLRAQLKNANTLSLAEASTALVHNKIGAPTMPLEAELNPKVLAYIQQHELYR